MAAAATATSRALPLAVGLREHLLHEAGVEVAGDEGGVAQHAVEEGQRGLDAEHRVLGERAPHARDRLVAVGAVGHQLESSGS